MTIIIDLVIVGIIAICTILGYMKGLTGALIKILSFVLSLVIAFVLFVPVSNFVINNTQIDETIERKIRETVITQDVDNQKKDTMPTAMTKYINEKLEEATKEAKEAVVDNAAKDVSIIIVKAGTWIALFLVARVLLILLKFITNIITSLPVIKQFDKIGGIIYGLIEGIVITYIALAIISFITPMTDGKLSENISKSYIGGMMYSNNLLLNIIF